MIKFNKKYILPRSNPFLLIGVVLISLFFSTQLVLADTNVASHRYPDPIALCDEAVKRAGIPIDGLSGWPVVRIDFRPEATEDQKQQAWDIVHNFNYKKEIAAFSGEGLVTSYGSTIPKLTQDGQISIAQINGYPYIYFQANGQTQHILGASSFEISAEETIDAISGEKMEVGDFVIGMIDKNLHNGKTADDSSLHGIWVKWSSVKADLIKELQASGGLDSAGAVSGVDSSSLLGRLAAFGISIKDGITHIASLAVDKLTAKVVTIEKLQLIDKATGETYCTWLENGEWKKEKGECPDDGNIEAQTQVDPAAAAPVEPEVLPTQPETSQSSPPDQPSESIVVTPEVVEPVEIEPPVENTDTTPTPPTIEIPVSDSTPVETQPPVEDSDVISIPPTVENPVSEAPPTPTPDSPPAPDPAPDVPASQ